MSYSARRTHYYWMDDVIDRLVFAIAVRIADRVRHHRSPALRVDIAGNIAGNIAAYIAAYIAMLRSMLAPRR